MTKFTQTYPTDLKYSEWLLIAQFPLSTLNLATLSDVCLLLWLWRRGDDPVLVNSGMVWAAILLTAVGLMSFTSGWTMHVDEKQALVAA